MRARLLGLSVASALVVTSGCDIYRSDVGKMCDAEHLSEATLKGSRAQLFAWMEKAVSSSDAVIRVRELEGKDLHGIGAALKDEARNAGLTSCVLADIAEAEAKDEDFRRDVANLCAGSAIKADRSSAHLEIAALDDAERMREMVDWTHANARSEDTAAIVAKLLAAPAKQRGALLRTESAKLGVATCAMATTLDTPPPAPGPAVDLRDVNPSFVVTRVEGPAKNQVPIAQALVDREPATAINACYANALAGSPTLSGKVSLKLQIDPAGHVTPTNDGSTVKGPLLQCVTAAVAAVGLPGLPDLKKGAKGALTLQLTPTTDPISATIDPAWLAKATPKHK